MNLEIAQKHAEIHEHKDPPLKSLPITVGNIPRFALLLPILIYQKTFSNAVPADTCRFYPTCSHYAYQAIFKHGALKGGWMGFTRLLRCNPYNKGGYDPVP